MSKIEYDTYFVSTMNHLYKNSLTYVNAMINEVFKQGTDFQKAYCSGLEDFLYGENSNVPMHQHVTLPYLVTPPMVADGYATDKLPLKQFLKYNVWVSEVGGAA